MTIIFKDIVPYPTGEAEIEVPNSLNDARRTGAIYLSRGSIESTNTSLRQHASRPVHVMEPRERVHRYRLGGQI